MRSWPAPDPGEATGEIVPHFDARPVRALCAVRSFLRHASARAVESGLMRRAQGRERRLAVLALVAGLIVAGCQRAAPPISATRVAEIPEANTPGSYMDAVALASDGSRVATGERGGVIRVWTVDSASQGVRVGAYRQGINDLAFSPDGALLATIGRHRESTLRFWEDDRT